MYKRKILLTLLFLLLLPSAIYADSNTVQPQKENNKNNTKTQNIGQSDEKDDKNTKAQSGTANNDDDTTGFLIDHDPNIDEDEVLGLSKTPEQLEDSSIGLDVINKSQMNLINPTSLESILDTTPGVTVQRQGSIGNLTNFSIRGWDQSLVTLDGIRINDQGFNQPFLNPLFIDFLDRIEVIKGPSSTLHGTQALAGVVSLYTKQGSGRPSIEVGAGLGNNSTFKEKMVFQGGTDKLDYYLGLVRIDTTGGAPTFFNESQNDDYGNFSLINNIGGKILKGKAELRNIFSYSTGEKENAVQVNGFPIFDPDDHSYNSIIYENLTFTHAPTKWYEYNVKFAGVKTIYKDYDNDKIIDFDFLKTYNNRLMFLTQHNFYYKDINTFTVGYDLEYNDFKSIDVRDATLNKDLTKHDVYFHDSLNIKDTLFIRGGTRLVHYGLFGSYATPNVSAALKRKTFNIKDSYTKFRTSYGYALDEPSPYQLFGLFGNPFLRPEKSFGWDIGAVQSFYKDKLKFECSYFKNKVTDLISRDPNANTLTLRNIARARTSGIEASMNIDIIKHVKATVNYTYLNARQQNLLTGKYDPIESIPNNSWNFVIGYSPKKDYGAYFKGNTSSTRLGEDLLDFKPVRTKGFVDLGLGAMAKLFEVKGYKLIWFGQMTNLMNKKYMQVYGYKHDGFRFLTGVKFTKTF